MRRFDTIPKLRARTLKAIQRVHTAERESLIESLLAAAGITMLIGSIICFLIGF